MADPCETDPTHYAVILENDLVRVLEYRDLPGDRTHDHTHPGSVMITLSGFDRRLTSGERSLDVHLEPFQARWLDAQTHRGENTGPTPTHAIFVELKEAGGPGPDGRLGPQGG